MPTDWKPRAERKGDADFSIGKNHFTITYTALIVAVIALCSGVWTLCWEVSEFNHVQKEIVKDMETKAEAQSQWDSAGVWVGSLRDLNDGKIKVPNWPPLPRDPQPQQSLLLSTLYADTRSMQNKQRD